MAIVCVNGHVNNEANRFCDQCGAPLDQSAPEGVTAASDAVAPTSSSGAGGSVLCPQCGQQNLPGTAFCDNCGAALPPPQPAQDSAALPPSDTEATMQENTTTDSDTVVCPQCGTVNAATNRFCDNCGMALANLGGDQQAASEQGQAMTNDAQAGADVQQEQAAPAVQPSEPDQPAEEVAEPTTTAPDTEPPGATQAADREDETQAAQPAAAAGTPDSSAQRQQLEATIATQQRLIDQLEQMQATFGAATPPAVLQGLDEARATLAQAQAELEALQAPAPAIDPAEVARLEAAVATQQQLVSQLEQMQATFGAATPPAVLQGLDEARAGLAQVQAELEALTGAPATRSTPAPGAPVPAEMQTSEAAAQHADETAAQPVAGDESPAAPMATPQAAEQPASPPPLPEPEAMAPEAAVAADQQAQPAAPDVSGPRLVTRDGQTIKLPQTEGDILIGRQDPVSGVYPGVDLTPHGGEAGGVSRRHALLREQNGQWMLTDLDSTNYTRVDGNRIAPHTPTEVGDGARLQFGRLELEFHTS